MKLPDFYIVAVSFPREGLGSKDLTPSRDQAYDNFAEAMDDGCPARAFLVQFCLEHNTVEAVTEVTDTFASQYRYLIAERNTDVIEDY